MGNEAILLKNELNISFRINPKSPLLVKESLGKNADCDNAIAWLLKEDGKGSEKPYIPGSTLKGLFRERFTSIYYDYLFDTEEFIKDKKAYKKAEDQLKLDREDEAENNIGKEEGKKSYKEARKDVFEKFQEIMEEKYKNIEDKSEVYKKSLKVEQLFGSKVLKGRFWASDALFEGEYTPLTFNDDKNIKEGNSRSITPIDRFTGGAVVPLNFEYTTNPFTFHMKIKNVTEDELKYLLLIIRDSQNGEVRIGSSKTRGFGQVEFTIDSLGFKDFRDQNNEFSMDSFATIDEDQSIKIGDQYLVKSYKFDNKYLAIDRNNPFVKQVMGGNR